MTCFRMDNGETLKSYCNRMGYKYGVIYRRLDAGFSVKEAIEDYLAIKSKKKISKIMYFYKDEPLWKYCEKNGIKYQAVCYRIRNGLSLEEAVKQLENYKIIGKRYNKYKYSYKGLTLKEYCDKYNIDYFMCIYRINKGYSVKEAIDIVKSILTKKA